MDGFYFSYLNIALDLLVGRLAYQNLSGLRIFMDAFRRIDAVADGGVDDVAAGAVQEVEQVGEELEVSSCIKDTWERVKFKIFAQTGKK